MKLHILAAAGVAALATLTFVPPASAASSDCANGGLCLWDDSGFTDTRKRFTASENDMNDIGFGDKASSAYNRTSVAWVLWGNHDYTGDALCLKAGASSTNLDNFSGFGDKTSSAKKRSNNTCPSGVTAVTGPN